MTDNKPTCKDKRFLESLVRDASSIDWFKRWNVSRHKDAPAKALLLLSRDYDSLVRCGVANNPYSPVEALVILAEDVSGNIRAEVMKNPNTPEAVKIWLRLDGYAGLTLAEFIVATSVDRKP
jgi:hypothetical protein